MAESLPSRQFFGHRFPVVYYRQDPSVARVLIHPDEFREFGFVFPDSLQYVKAWLP
ncbi:MAG: hypothetical protein MUD08_10520 [Cytophagales bacterium]|nr:hypothetical protein [Cytophagales bacterium]